MILSQKKKEAIVQENKQTNYIFYILYKYSVTLF